MTKKYALIPFEDRVQLCTFDGTFDEGEGISMGQPVKWKYPNIATVIKTMGRLCDYNSKVGEWVKEAVSLPDCEGTVYVEGLPGHTGWWDEDGPR